MLEYFFSIRVTVTAYTILFLMMEFLAVASSSLSPNYIMEIAENDLVGSFISLETFNVSEKHQMRIIRPKFIRIIWTKSKVTLKSWRTIHQHMKTTWKIFKILLMSFRYHHILRQFQAKFKIVYRFPGNPLQNAIFFRI